MIKFRCMQLHDVVLILASFVIYFDAFVFSDYYNYITYYFIAMAEH